MCAHIHTCTQGTRECLGVTQSDPDSGFAHSEGPGTEPESQAGVQAGGSGSPLVPLMADTMARAGKRAADCPILGSRATPKRAGVNDPCLYRVAHSYTTRSTHRRHIFAGCHRFLPGAAPRLAQTAAF